MKLFLLIILCFQLLQRDDAATFEDRKKENMVDESLSYDYAAPEEEMGATVDQWNENTYEDTNNQFDSLKNEKDTTQSEYSFNDENQWKKESSFVDQKMTRINPKKSRTRYMNKRYIRKSAEPHVYITFQMPIQNNTVQGT